MHKIIQDPSLTVSRKYSVLNTKQILNYTIPYTEVFLDLAWLKLCGLCPGHQMQGQASLKPKVSCPFRITKRPQGIVVTGRGEGVGMWYSFGMFGSQMSELWLWIFGG